VAGFWRRTGTAVNLCSVVQQRSGNRLAPGRGGSQAARRRGTRGGTGLLREDSRPTNRAELSGGARRSTARFLRTGWRSSDGEASRLLGRLQLGVAGILVRAGGSGCPRRKGWWLVAALRKAAGKARQDEESSKGVPTMDCAARCAKGLDAQLYRQTGGGAGVRKCHAH
jgi:hypothetical protein